MIIYLPVAIKTTAFWVDKNERKKVYKQTNINFQVEKFRLPKIVHNGKRALDW